MFTLHPQLERDTLAVTELSLCRVLLMNNALFPWLVLVPQQNELREIIDLDASGRHLLMDEIAHVSQVMQRLFTPEKLNVAALGNQVPQLHIHVIARKASDAAWPGPVWGKGCRPYTDTAPLLEQLRNAMTGKAL